MVNSVCVFCGAQYGDYRQAAARLGAELGSAGLEVVYGGGHVGLMGALADAAMTAGGRVVGLIPERLLEREVGNRAITELQVTDSMFERKRQMIERADAFVTLPGGLGTLDELLEVITLRQLGYHAKPILLIDLDGYWQPFVGLVEHVIRARFAAPAVRDLFQLVDSVEAVLPALGVPPATASRSVAAG